MMEIVIICIIGLALIATGLKIEHPYNIGWTSTKSRFHKLAIAGEVIGVILLLVGVIGGIGTILHL